MNYIELEEWFKKIKERDNELFNHEEAIKNNVNNSENQ